MSKLVRIGPYRALYISASGTYTPKTSLGILHSVVVGETDAESILIYDTAIGFSNLMVELKPSIIEGTYIFNLSFSNGLRIVTNGDSKITVLYE